MNNATRHARIVLLELRLNEVMARAIGTSMPTFRNAILIIIDLQRQIRNLRQEK